MTEEYVILVDEADRELGVMEKLEAHQKGLLHRAISVVVFNSKGEMLLQQRALTKYHSGGLWTNACCSHPRKGETNLEAAERRLVEEMGIKLELKEVGSFVYRATLDKNLVEHELDHVFSGVFDGDPAPDPSEAMAWKYVPIAELKSELKSKPELYTEWFKIMWQTEGLFH